MILKGGGGGVLVLRGRQQGKGVKGFGNGAEGKREGKGGRMGNFIT